MGEVLHSRWMEDLSFVPRTPRFAPEEATFISYEFYYVIPGREKAFEAGCDAYETKPIELPRLLETMEKLLQG